MGFSVSFQFELVSGFFSRFMIKPLSERKCQTKTLLRSGAQSVDGRMDCWTDGPIDRDGTHVGILS